MLRGFFYLKTPLFFTVMCNYPVFYNDLSTEIVDTKRFFYYPVIATFTLLNLNDVDFNRNKILVKRVKEGFLGEKPLFRDTKKTP